MCKCILILLGILIFLSNFSYSDYNCFGYGCVDDVCYLAIACIPEHGHSPDDSCCPGASFCHGDSCCTPACAGKCAGASDGCGGDCPNNNCPYTCCGSTCCSSGQVCNTSCYFIDTAMLDAFSGTNFYSTTYPNNCLPYPSCCTPQCSGKNCGDNSCGGSCGTCTGNYNCVSGVCTCSPPTCGAGTYYASASCSCAACGTNTWQCAGCPITTKIWTGTACVECTDDSHCTSYVAPTYTPKPPICKTSTNTCVYCTSNSHCTSVSASNCSSSNTCVACVNDSACNHLTATKCISGICKDCRNVTDCASDKICSNNNCIACTDGHVKSGNSCVCPADKPYEVGGVCKVCTAEDPSLCASNQNCVSNTCTNLVCDTTKRLVALDHTCKCDPTSNYPIWNGEKCVCNPTSCGAGFACVNNDCASVCPVDLTPLGTCSQTEVNKTKMCMDVGGSLELVDKCSSCGCTTYDCNLNTELCCNATLPKFNETKGCVECNRHSDCSQGERCDNNVCIPCLSDGTLCPTCPNSYSDYRPRWNGTTCVECVSASDCMPNEVCGNGFCSAGCEGTPLGQCSPYLLFCRESDGQFETNCYINQQQCGYSCPEGYECNEGTGNCDEIIIPVARCDDGTEINTCSINTPYFCYDYNGVPTLMSNCGQCPPDDGYGCTEEEEAIQNEEAPLEVENVAGNTTVGECVPGVLGWKKIEGKVVADCVQCNCPSGYTCGANNRCISLLTLDLNLAAGEKQFITCPGGKILAGTTCVDCASNEQCGPNKNCSNGHCCPSYAPVWDAVKNKCTCETGGCYAIKPWACTNGNFMPNCELCGCPEGYDCRDNFCYEKPGAVMSKINIPDINPFVSLLLLVSFLLFFKK